MLDKKTFGKFIDEINTSYYFFQIWVHSNNEFAKIQDNEINDALKKLVIFTLNSLSQTWVLAIARLLDKAYFLEDKEKPRLSATYIIDELENKLLEEYKEKMGTKEMKQFIYSNRQLRDVRFSHNTTGKKPTTQKAGVEKYFDILEWLVKDVKTQYPELNISESLNYEHFNELARMGAIELFKKF